MTHLPALVAFAETARRSSFAEAARELGLTPSAVAKSVARLEADLGLRLFHRTTRKVALTGEGRSLFHRCERIVEEVEALRDEAAGARAEPSGTLRLSVPITLGKRLIVPALAALAAGYPRIAVEVSFTDRFTDLVGEGLDAAVRIGPLADSRLVAKPLCDQQLIVVAAPRYLAARGTPRRPRDLETHTCIAFRMPTSGRLWIWRLRDRGRAFEWEPPRVVVLDDGEAIVAAATAGMGLAQVPDYMAADALASRRVVEVLEAYRRPAMPVSVVYPSARRVTPRLRAFIEVLERQPWKRSH